MLTSHYIDNDNLLYNVIFRGKDYLMQYQQTSFFICNYNLSQSQIMYSISG